MSFLNLNAGFLWGTGMVSGVCYVATVLLLGSSLSAAKAEEFYRIQKRPRQIQLFDVPNGGTSAIEAEDGNNATTIEINLSRSVSSWADCLAKFSAAEHVTIRTTGDVCFSLKWMDHLQSVQTLDMRNAQLTPLSSANLSRMPRLRELMLGRHQHTAEYMDAVCRIPTLRKLTLEGDAAAPELILRLSSSQSLQHLEVSQGPCTESLAKVLTQLTSVTSLTLGQLDDSALRHLIAADQHRRLVFDGSQCSPKEVLQLAGMRRPNYLVINGSPFPPTAIPFLRSRGKMTGDERLMYYERMLRAVETKRDRSVMTREGVVIAGNSLDAERLRSIDFRIAFLESQLRQYPRIRPSGGFLGGLYDQAEDAGNFAARSMILEDLAELEQQKAEIVCQGSNQETFGEAGFSQEELQFGVAFGLISL